MQDKLIGRNPVKEMLKSGGDIDKIFVKKEADGSLVPILRMARERHIPVSEVDRRKLDSLAEGENHQGIVAFVPCERYYTPAEILGRAREKGRQPFVVILDKICDPHNLGSIIRTANCAGADGVIIPKHGSAPLGSVAAKTSAGATAYTPVARVTNVARTIDELKKEGLWIIGADMDGENTIYTQDFSGNIAIVIGSEGEGISPLIKKTCDFLVKIPMYGEVTSLNASVAGALMIYEAVRKRHEM